MTVLTVQSLRTHAISNSLFSPTTLKGAIERLKFVQADPIRSPARAQDLILRQRVENYRAGDLERQYPGLDIEEDVLYAYGFLPRDIWEVRHPRKTIDLTEFEREILDTVRKLGETHPKQLEVHFGRERVVNAWGGYTKATTRALENLHYQGLLRVARRQEGIRIYEALPPLQLNAEPSELNARFRTIIKVIANIFAPVTERCLQEALAPLRRSTPEPVNTRTIISELLKNGDLEKQTIDGINYLYPAGNLNLDEAPMKLRLLAPFDPLVWDRRRFEHFWGWSYRFEAYTPPANRLRGYYAMPMLWGDSIIGWANISVQKKVLHAELGFIEKKPTNFDFSLELEKEIERLKIFLN
jgi:uncharacterized protein YcaQ